MMKTIYLGNNQLKVDTKNVDGSFVNIDNEQYYKISNYDHMADFFMTIVSDSDHWMYLSSNGALTAGRKNRDNALFPYYTEDKIHDYKGKTGSKTICRVTTNDKSYLWEPFDDVSAQVYSTERNLYKSIYGNKIIFEEINYDLNLSFQYGWYNSERFGWIKKANIRNLFDHDIEVEILDGIQNILPYGSDHAFQNEYSNLMDAYKKNELIPKNGMGLFMLSSIPVDRAEPSEALKTTTVWSCSDIEPKAFLVSNHQLDAFKKGFSVNTELDVRASRGAYYLNLSLNLQKDNACSWFFALEVNQDLNDIAKLEQLISKNNTREEVIVDIEKGTQNLIKRVASADGLQLGADKLCYARHFSNSMYNIMRGGIYFNAYKINTTDYKQFIEKSNKQVFSDVTTFLNQLPETIGYNELVKSAQNYRNIELERLTLEYLPLTFSRRHGDPSRPWNQFSIELRNDDGSEKLNYQGNWRDIFQNWEALNYSFPEYTEGIISKFLNATTLDGYNPYRITRDGIDWEAPDPNDPWAYIGYWGDHQIIYLQKFLEQSMAFHPDKLEKWLDHKLFVFANVPYRIKSFVDMVKNPQDTILFDHELNEKIEKRSKQLGADGRLVFNEDGRLCRANLMEKILVTLLAKLSNFIPETGIWLNTQRPEWNDANNALVGNGVSMVTLYYIRRFLMFWQRFMENVSIESIELHKEVADHFKASFNTFNEFHSILSKGFTDEQRYAFTQKMGKAGELYRTQVYSNSLSTESVHINTTHLKQFMKLALAFADQTILKNKREDGLYHSYNLAVFKGNEIKIRRLYEMLEGQVAVLSSGLLSPEETLNLLDALKASKMFREDQYSYMLYPNRELARFMDKNTISNDFASKSELLKTMHEKGNHTIAIKDVNGNFHFNGEFRNADMLASALNSLNDNELSSLVQKEFGSILVEYERLFDHQSFTGRSGTFYGYEGLGSIYWHMVSKLLLAVQENFFMATDLKADTKLLGRIKAHYYEIKAGIGLYKSPKLYGAFPTDAYSHTPGGAGAKQPGLTGQVKEDVISRFGELGIRIANGCIVFNTELMNYDELLTADENFTYQDCKGNEKAIPLSKNELALTIGQTPAICSIGESNKILVEFSNGSIETIEGNTLPNNLSREVFERTGDVTKIKYQFKNQ